LSFEFMLPYASAHVPRFASKGTLRCRKRRLNSKYFASNGKEVVIASEVRQSRKSCHPRRLLSGICR